MANAFNKEIVRSITQSAGRFIAILIISFLGAGVYAGLRMSAPDMRIAGDEFFDGCNLYDVSVVSTLGFDDESISTLRGVDGVKAVMPAYRADAMVQVGERSYAASIESLPLEDARESDTADGLSAKSDNDEYLNRPILLDGAWPQSSSECVVGARAAAELGIAIGDEITIGKTTSDIDDVFSLKQFTVSGMVNSPAYASTSVLGVTSLGSGELELYLYVDDSAFAEDYPYSVAYLTVAAAGEKTWASSGYDESVEDVKKHVQELAPEIAQARWSAVKADAQAELDDARAEYEEERAEAESDLEDARVELADASAKLEDAEAELQTGAAEVYDAGVQIAENEEKLRKAEEEYASGKKQLDEQRKAFEEQAAGLNELKSQRVQLVDGIDQAKSGITQLEQGIAQAESGAALLEQQLAQAKQAGAPEEQIAAIETQLQGVRAQLSQLQAQLADTQAQVAQLESQLQQLDGGIAAIEAGKAQLDNAQAQLDAARAELDAGWAQLESGRTQYLDGFAQYQSGLAEYEQGKRDYEDGLAEYEDGRAEADREFADAEAELADAQADIDDIEQPEVFVLDRSKNVGAAQLSSDADGITQIATFLPFMFFLVAALVSLTSMTRMVDEERMAIGTHKALGYNRGRITSKYLVYGVLASGIGSILGIVVLGKMLPWFIITSYQVSYAVPGVPLPIDPFITAKALGLSVGVTALATWGAVSASLREKPAALLLPRVPRAGKRIFLERIEPLWSRMSFSHKVTARNLLRYKRRFFMAVIGIAGCTALLMVGFGLRDAIGSIVSDQYSEIVRYDVAVRLDDDASDEARAQVDAALSSDAVAGHMAVHGFNLIAEGPDDELRIDVVVPQDADAFADYVALHNRQTGENLALGDRDIVLTEKAATVLGLKVGDQVVLYDENEVGDKEGEGRTFTVGGIAENYLGHSAYLSVSCYREAFGEEPSFDLEYVKFAQNESGYRDAFSDELLSIEGVSTVSFVADKVVTYESMLDIMNKLIFVIVGLSAALAFVVLYNLTNINIGERIREIATLKVLGFTRGEVNAYIFREIIVMSLIGALIGCVLGAPLTTYIAETAETPQMMFGRTIELLSYVLSFVITMAFSAIVTFTMRGKLANVNMVESLKSNE